jgi:hypothetical protein
MNGYQSLGVKKETKKRLIEICKKSETIDACLNRLIDFYHKEHKWKIGE